MGTTVSVDKCVVCGASSPQPAYSVRDIVFGDPGEWQFVQCGGCGHGYLDPRPTDAALAELYGGLYTPENLRAMEAIGKSFWERRLHAARIGAIREALPGRDDLRIVDVGCGMGFYLRALKAAFPTAMVIGVELNEEAAATAKAIPGVDVRQQPFQEAELPKGEVDVVTMNHLLEHMQEPGEVIEQAAELVAPGGLIEVEVPRQDGWGRRLLRRWYWPHLPPQHLQVFTTEGLSRLLAERGFGEVVWTHTSAYPFLATTTLVLLVRYTVGSRSAYASNWLVRGPVVLLGFAMLPTLLLFDLLVAPVLNLMGMGDVVTVVARRDAEKG